MNLGVWLDGVSSAAWLATGATLRPTASSVATAITAASWQATDFPLANALVAFVLFFLQVANRNHLATTWLGTAAAAIVAPAAWAIATTMATGISTASIRATTITAVATAATLFEPVEASQARATFVPGANHFGDTDFFAFDLPAMLFDLFFLNASDANFFAAIATAVVVATTAAATGRLATA